MIATKRDTRCSSVNQLRVSFIFGASSSTVLKYSLTLKDQCFESTATSLGTSKGD
jgi:hypothetical protein